MTGHRCRVETTTSDPFYPGHPGYQAVCEDCGNVGPADDEPRNAQAIANRHEEIGGFERPSGVTLTGGPGSIIGE